MSTNLLQKCDKKGGRKTSKKSEKYFLKNICQLWESTIFALLFQKRKETPP